MGPEPNNSRGSEDYLIWNAHRGGWNDESAEQEIGKIIVEYSPDEQSR